MKEDEIKVLWVEDDPRLIVDFPREIEGQELGVTLYPVSCWDDAKEALEKDFSSWDAIILDAKCKQHRDSADNATKFLSEALSGLRFMYAKYHRTINWYILSGGSEEELNDSILDDRKAWDGDWPKLYYSKATDKFELINRIIAHVNMRSEETQVKTVFFRDVFEAIREARLGEEVEKNMVDLLVPVVFPGGVLTADYNNRFKNARIVLEHVFRGMIDMGMLPPSLGKNNGRDAVNMSWCCNFISGRPSSQATYSIDKNIFPRIFYNNVWNIVNTIGSSVHSATEGNGIMVSFKQYQAGTGETPYLLKSFAYQLCDVILWYGNYIKENNDPTVNERNWIE